MTLNYENLKQPIKKTLRLKNLGVFLFAQHSAIQSHRWQFTLTGPPLREKYINGSVSVTDGRQTVQDLKGRLQKMIYKIQY